MSLNSSVKNQVAALTANSGINALLSIASRLLMSIIFIAAGYGKITAYAATEGYMASKGVPTGLLPVVIATELGGGLLLLIGFQVRLIAILLTGFTLITGFIFHSGSDQVSQIMLLKNFAMAGGLLAFVRTGAGKASVDGE